MALDFQIQSQHHWERIRNHLRVAVTLTARHNGVLYLCIANSTAGNVKTCSLGPFTVLPANPDLTTQSFTLTTSKTSSTSNGIQRDSNPSITRPFLLTTTASTDNPSSASIFTSTVAVICAFVIIITVIAFVVIIILVKTHRCGNCISRRKKAHNQRQVKSGINVNPEETSPYGECVYYHSAQDTASVQTAPDGVLYAVVDERKSQESLAEIGSGIAPTKTIKAPPDGVHYAVVDKRKSQESLADLGNGIAPTKTIKAPPDGVHYAVVDKRKSQESLADLGSGIAPTKTIKAAPDGVHYAVVDKRKSQESLADLGNGIAPTKTIKAPPDGVHYAVVDKRKSQESLADLGNGIAPAKTIKAAPDGVHYAVVDKRKSQESLADLGCGIAPVNNHKGIIAQSDTNNKVPAEPALYANVNEPSLGTNSPSHKRASPTTKTAVPCSEDSFPQDPTADISQEGSSSPTVLAVPCSDEIDNNKYIYETVNTMDCKHGTIDADNNSASSIADQPELLSKDITIDGIHYADLELSPSGKTDEIISKYEPTMYADLQQNI
ncbi:uncharacterized protein [Amphiura filiformis]|uniref:uncharacterized protein n=1 Tax=Amphiura filiformis TaxID=82378 RepID=UPI003B2176C3